MTVSARLARALQQALGNEAAEDLVNLFETRDASMEALRADLAEVRQEMHVGFARLNSELTSRIEQRFSDLFKWSFVFWVGSVVVTVGAITMILTALVR